MVACLQHGVATGQVGPSDFTVLMALPCMWPVEQAKASLSSQVGIDMTRDPQYYKGDEHCDDLEGSSFWQKEAKRILERVDQSKYDEHILMWLAA